MNDPFEMLAELGQAVAHVKMELAEVRYAMDRTIRHGKVTDLDAQKQLARIEIGEKDGEPVKSPWLPYAQVAGPDGQGQGNGEYKFHNPPAIGQQMTVFAPNGELRQGVLMPFTWHDGAQSPSNAADEHVVTYGKLRLSHRKDEYRASLGSTEVELTESSGVMRRGSVEVEVKDGRVNVSAPKVHVVGKVYLGVEGKDEEPETELAKNVYVQELGGWAVDLGSDGGGGDS